jgi:hypothetical protein
MIQALGKFRFPQHDFEFVNPLIEIDLQNIKANVINMTIDIYVNLHTDSAPSKATKFGQLLENIPVDTFNFDTNNQQDMNVLGNRILIKLNEFKLTEM